MPTPFQLALAAYGDALVEYHACKAVGTEQDQRRAHAALLTAQEALNDAAVYEVIRQEARG